MITDLGWETFTFEGTVLKQEKLSTVFFREKKLLFENKGNFQ